MYLLDGETVQPTDQFESGGILYPAGWINTATPEELTAAGIVYQEDEPRPDDFYAAVEPDPDEPWKWISTPYTPEEMKPRLEEYSIEQRDNKMNSGVSHTIGGVEYTVPTDYVTRNQFFNYRVIQERPGGPTQTPTALMHTGKEIVLALTEVQLLSVEVKMEQRVHDCYATQQVLQQGIQDQTVTTKEQIDTAYGAIA